ncbi:Rrf2 family transcriptional regulator, iron-sulfur cluster assembly transcription factor [Bathymodiolus platifrons methanotrophic gill symbiont]|uniref:Rrf2 family transcriptional regulator n=1 Tax=Bathymodiolus platifrons methanotrophic gill symbiont TaxID=113268 RepID=UPI000B40E3C0|nr:Rrf2 family transcriptional regulator [Bathymodiolus platifrons methanotrophic gill symbiont]MCK5869332.1 Rrf2 family transcriptional regulator [Methyloprofundus sp.]TXK93241.1 Fe-S cluster assembly transcriptional regulator IscR [Methylococcaceae bacterium CS4]TXK94852.1 Fe-S cluster assembly transcriptional regulator IscR [Methylococcaceae bacterium HT1]TXL00029.1 Fe-S cluster assembly transcriptional regulator IscR [Methylococcaceae bacterium CS5]TXL02688.1 Fe-S cluster assembly transcri
MRLTTKGRYAVTAMLDLAFHSRVKPVTLTEIATRQTISLSYLEQLFSRLRRANMVIGVRGPGGGYKLSRGAEEISISDIILAVDEQVDLTNCEQKSNCQNGQPCLTHDLWMGLSDTVRNYLDGITLKQLLDQADVQAVAQRQDSDVQQIMQFRDAETIGMALK